MKKFTLVGEVTHGVCMSNSWVILEGEIGREQGKEEEEADSPLLSLTCGCWWRWIIIFSWAVFVFFHLLHHHHHFSFLLFFHFFLPCTTLPFSAAFFQIPQNLDRSWEIPFLLFFFSLLYYLAPFIPLLFEFCRGGAMGMVDGVCSSGVWFFLYSNLEERT